MKRSLGNHHEVAHVWASQSQSEGYGSNMLFFGPSIYSYGTHFEIARIVKPGVVLFNNRSYSTSTSKHQGRARSAVSHMKVFTVPSMTDHNANAAFLIERLDADLFRITRMRKNSEWALDMYKSAAVSAAEYIATFKKDISAANYKAIKARYEARENPLTTAQMAKFKKIAEANREKAKAERIEKETRAAARKLELQKVYDAWKAGEIASLPWEAQELFPVALRVTTGTDDGVQMIQTSKNARVPLIEARKLYHALMKSPDVAGMRVGHYTVTGVRGTDLVIGCHTIPLREVVRMAGILGFEEAA